MRGEAGDAPTGRLAAPLQLESEHQTGQLGLTIGRHRTIATAGVQIVEVDGAAAGGDARQAHDPRRRRLAQQRHQMRRQREMAQIIGAELKFEPIRGLHPGRRHHDRRVVDQDIQMGGLAAQALAEGRDRGQVRQIEALEPDQGRRDLPPDPGHGLCALVRIATGDDDFGSGAGQGERILQTEPARAGHHGRAARLVRNLVNGPTGHGGSSFPPMGGPVRSILLETRGNRIPDAPL